MVNLRKKVEQGVEGEEVMRLLFREEYGDLGEDGFEGSKEEYQIFEEVFYRTNAEDAKTGKDTHTKRSATINHGDSVLRNSTSMKDSSGKAYEGAKMNFRETSAFESFQESSSSCVGSSAHSALVLWAKPSPMKHLGQGKKDPECINYPAPSAGADLACLHPSNVVLDVPTEYPIYEPVSSTMQLNQEKEGLEHNYPDNSTELLLLKTSKFVTDMPVESDQEAVQCRVIETLEQGILSTRNICNHQGDMAATCADGAFGVNYNCRVQQEEDVKVVVESKSVTSPVSQESVASVLLASAHLAPKETSSAIICAEQNAEEHMNLETADAAVKLRSSQKKELSCHLQVCAHRLLKDAGWKIEPRQRNDKSTPAYFINNKEGLVSKALAGAWKACGERLLSSALDSERDENGREWWDVDSFWRDMTDTMAYIDQQESSVSLLHRWQLLDPFMTIVWMDKKLSTLRGGKGLKAVKSTAFILDASRETISAEMAVNKADKNAGEVSSCLARSLNQSILPAYQNPEVIDLQNQNRLVRADPKCCCSEDFYKEGVKGLAMHTGKGLGPHNVECQHMGSTGLGSQQKRSNISSSKSKFMLRGPKFPNAGPNENKNLFCMEEASSLGEDDNCGQINNESEMQCPGVQDSQHEGNIVSSTGSNLICNSVFQDFSSLPLEGSSVAGETVGSETTKSKRKRTAAAPGDGSAKKTRKKSKKISEIGAIEVIGKDTKTELHDGDHTEELVPSIVDKTDKQLDPECYLKDTNDLISEPSRECLSNAHHTSRFEDVNVPTNVKVHKKNVKSETKAAGQCGKEKGDLIISQEDEQQSALLEQNREHHKPAKGECKAKRLTPNKSNSTRSKKHKVAPEFNMAHHQLLDPTVAVLADNGTVPKEFDSEDICDEILSATGGVCPERESNQKHVRAKKAKVKKKNGQKNLQCCRINDDDLLIAAIIKKKDFGSSGKQFSPGASQSKAPRKIQNQKGRSKLLPRALRKRGNHSVEGRRITLVTRTVLCWLIEMGALSLKDELQYRNPKNNTVVKDGLVTSEGIRCKCCGQIFSMSEFKAHAGLKQHRPSLNLFIHSGKPYTVCELEAWAAEFKKRKSNLRLIGADEKDKNDDTCGLCGDGGDLICCDNCPSTYHQTCLSAQELPDGNWYCPNCICVTCKDLVNAKETSSSSAMLECAQCEHKYHSACIARKVACNGDIDSNAWFCGENCQEVYFGLRSRVGLVNHIDDGFSWTILRCSHDDQKVCSAQKIALMAECNSKLAIALNLMEECFLPMVDPRTGIDMIPHVLYNLGSPFARLNYQGFYAVVLEKDDQLISVASIRVHGATVAEMPLIATCSDHRRQGMCRRLLNAIEKMLVSFKVKVLVLSAIPSLVETWTSGFGFKLLEDEDKKQLTNVNLMLFPGTTLLTKNLNEASSAQESAENVDFCSREQQSHILGTLMESASTLTGCQPTESSTSDLDANSLLPIISNTQVEKVSIQQRKTLMTSSENRVSTARHNEHGVVSNAGSCLNITASNINGMDQDFSTDQVVARQKPVANISSILHSSSSLFALKDTKIELLGSPSHTTCDVIIRDMEESIPQNISILTEDNAAEVMNGEREILSEGDEVARKLLVDGTQDKNDAILFDERAEKGPSAMTHEEVRNALSPNKTNVVTLRNMEKIASRNANILNESSAADTMKNEWEVSISGGIVESKSPVDASLGTTSACVSDVLAVGNTSLAASNLNEVNFEGINKGEVLGDDASGSSEDEICDSVGSYAVSKGCAAESV